MLRTYYWNERIVGNKHLLYRLLNKNPYHVFRHGNAGDIFVKDLIKWHYQKNVQHVVEEGKRLLTFGSIMHLAKPNDILAGIGYNPSEVLDIKTLQQCDVLSLRGPLTYDYLKSNSVNVDSVESLYDPGLMVRFMYSHLIDSIQAVKGRVSFLPHYRERSKEYKSIPNVHFIDIDNTPQKVCEEILKSEVVLTSSLHGLIFSHALGRPAVLIHPQTKENIFKYKDYFAAINQPFIEPKIDIYDALSSSLPISPIDLNYKKSDIYLPPLETLIKRGICV